MEKANYTVLALNDLPEQLELLSSILKTAGYDVLQASNPNAAIRLATRQQPDLIVSDVSKPLLDGFELHRRIRSVPVLADTPILVISALHLPDNSEAISNAHPTRDDFLESPYEPLALVAKVATLIERKRTQDELRHSQERYIELFDIANDIVYTHDLEGHYTSLNKRGQEITGYTMEEAAALEFNNLATEKDVALAKEMLGRKLAGDQTSTLYELSIKAKDGTIIPVEVNTQLIYKHGKPVGVQGIARDIRARKEAEEKFRQVSASLLEAERRAITEYKTLLERIAHLAQTLASARDLTPIFNTLLEFTTLSLPCNALGISLYDHENVEITPHFLWVEGQTLDLRHKEPLPLTSNSDVRTAILSRQTIISSSNGTPLAKLFQHAATDLKPRSSMTVPMTIMGRTVGTLEIQSTSENAYQAEHTVAMQMAANLAANTIENVRLLDREREQEEQWRQAQKMEAIGHLAGGLAHDLNNVLTAMYGNCDMLIRGLESSNPLRKHVHDIRDSAKRAHLLTSQLLAFSRKQVLQPVNLNLNTVVTDMKNFLGSLIGEDITVTCKLAENLPQIKADKSQLIQIILNLAVNARDAMPSGGTITIETSLVHLEKGRPNKTAKDSTTPHLELSFTDTGIGMNLETQKRIFEPFFTTKPAGKGTGMGLATVYGCVKQSGGSISLTSKENQGTSFKIHFPLAQHQQQLIDEGQLEISTYHQGSQTILIAEDDAAVRQVLRDELNVSGYKVIEAINGLDAWELFRQSQDSIELVITDVLMPQMNGRELALLINQTRPATHIIYISGHPANEITERGVLLEGVNFLPKPFNTHDLISKIRQVLGTSEPITATASPK